MGGCVSVQKNPDSNMKFRLSLGSKADKLVIPSPVQEKPLFNGDRPTAEAGLKSQWSPSQPATTVRDFGSKEESFFDSQAWLESDCEDDFLSVNGDFTPSRGSTPVHHSFAGAPRVNIARFDDKMPGSNPGPSPTVKKKRLSELFQGDEVFNDQNTLANQNGVTGTVKANKNVLGDLLSSFEGTPFISGANSVCSSERTPNGDYRSEKDEPSKYAHCCFPRMVLSRSSSLRKKKTSPAPSSEQLN